jgi:4-hydroxythreonine-4-phosphate dehydrogenase
MINTHHNRKSVIGITIGDPAGIGPEIVMKALLAHDLQKEANLIVFGDRIVLEQTMELIGKKGTIQEIESLEEARFEESVIHLVASQIISEPVEFGKVRALYGKAVYAYVTTAIDWALRGEIDGMATAPLQKEALQKGGCPYMDHTAILKAHTQSEVSTTLFWVDNLRIFFLTRHVPLRDVADLITAEKVHDGIVDCIRHLKQLGIKQPKLAVAALNPHGGEEGMMGDEEIQEIRPAIEKARNENLWVEGPVPADSVFHLANEGHFDGVLSLYHDQGHIAAKTLDFHRTVSFTMGLPFLRTSVDHGTAFNIAGKNLAKEISMVEAIRMAIQYSKIIRSASRHSGNPIK